MRGPAPHLRSRHDGSRARLRLIYFMPSTRIGVVDVRFRARELTDASSLIGTVTAS
jgi:hypothetical protein